jgi:zinc protease
VKRHTKVHPMVVLRRALASLTVVVAVPAPGVAQTQVPLTATSRSSARYTATGADTATSEFSVDGLRVILRRNTANDVVAANVYLLGGTQQLTPATQGIETLLLAASERGTKHYPKAAARLRIAQLGSRIIVDPSEDWTVFGLQTIRSAFDSSWAVFADRLMYPSLDSSEVELVRSQMLGGLQQLRSHPDEELETLADSLLYHDHPYGLSPRGTEQSIAGITLAQLRDYQRTQVTTSRLLLVVVGNVERASLERQVRATLAMLPRGTYQWKVPPEITTRTRALVTEARTLPTNYIMGYYAGPRAGTKDYQALRVAAAVLSGRFFTEIRSKRNLTYAVDAPFLERALAAGGVYVTTVSPDVTLGIMRDEIRRLQTETIDPEGLKRLVQQFITDYFLKNETNADQASFLARATLFEGDYRAANRFVEQLRDVTPADVRRVAANYMRDFRFVYLGDVSKAPRSLMAQF